VLRDAGADCVKFEGARPELVAALKDAGFDVCCHLGLESQHQLQKGRRGKTAQAARELLHDAMALDAAGQDFIVLELIPVELAERIAQASRAPTIASAPAPALTGRCWSSTISRGSRSASSSTIGVTAPLGETLRAAVAAYAEDVRAGRFPAAEHGFHMAPEERAAFERESGA